VKKLKVSIVVSDFSSSGAGRWGGGVRPFLLAEALRRLNYEVTMFGVAFGEVAQSIKNAPFPITALPCAYYSGFFSAASQIVKQIDGDLICAVKLKPSSFGIALAHKLFKGRPLWLDIDDWELSWHGGDKYHYGLNPKKFTRDLILKDGALRHPDHPLYLQWLEKLISQADLVTTHNQFLQKRFGGSKIPNGKDTDLFDPAKYNPLDSKIKYGLADYKIIMFPGAPRPYKGVEDVLIALEQLNRPDLKLAIVGGSPYDNYDRQLQEQYGKWMITLPCFPIDQMPEIVAAADLIVVPQRNTPASVAQFPLKLTDGMAMAKPILATLVGDIPEILADTGYLVEANSPKAIAEMIELIFNNFAQAQAKGLSARQRCIENYSIDAMTRIIQSLIVTLLNKL
jgi:glycosyltransferase involved in cell wall biosynthesis